MRIVPLLLITACATSPTESSPPDPNTLRGDLAAGVHLAITGSGSVAAKEKSGSGWSEGDVPLAITGGALAASAYDDTLVVDAATADFGPIAIPSSVIGGDASLTNVRLRLAQPTSLPLAWQDDDHASVTAKVDLVLDWSLTANGGTAPLGPQPLSGVPVTITLARDGAVTASAELTQTGMVWMWADVIELDNLALRLDAGN